MIPFIYRSDPSDRFSLMRARSAPVPPTPSQIDRVSRLPGGPDTVGALRQNTTQTTRGLRRLHPSGRDVEQLHGADRPRPSPSSS